MIITVENIARASRLITVSFREIHAEDVVPFAQLHRPEWLRAMEANVGQGHHNQMFWPTFSAGSSLVTLAYLDTLQG